ncbi:Uncharacterised protein [Mycobacterium tuberculosis]|nr:Uncharacterised protein [Mycobacterium tuberculosis]
MASPLALRSAPSRYSQPASFSRSRARRRLLRSEWPSPSVVGGVYIGPKLASGILPRQGSSSAFSSGDGRPWASQSVLPNRSFTRG